MERAARNRLAWKCRRGLLELDLVLLRYLEAHPGDEALERLLDLPDNDLWEIVSGRSDRFDPGLGATVARLRAV
ncbi:MAG TPA: succinate dehydrogenase assembly factor 2 [Burkholderiales bacterium]|nr:succinate dehydrogenase assembly factor 2 [Burkholderiales bacterium]